MASLLALLALAGVALTGGPVPGPAIPGGQPLSQSGAILSSTTWRLTSLSLGGTPITPGRLLTRPSFRLSGTTGRGTRGTDATVTGSTGCSPLTARVRVRGQTIVFRAIDPGSSDRCPDHALSLREDFLSLLAGVTRYQISGDVLTLHAPAGALVFSRVAGAGVGSGRQPVPLPSSRVREPERGCAQGEGRADTANLYPSAGEQPCFICQTTKIDRSESV